MLKELTIENLAIIKKIDLHFSEEFTVLTGETGAGKSIILTGLNILLGEKVSSDMIRTGSDFLMAEGVFEVSKELINLIKKAGIEIEEDEEIIIKRRLDANGRGKAFINGQRTSVKVLKAIMNNVVDLVGQHTHQTLLNPKNHLLLIDTFLKNDEILLKQEVAKVYKQKKELERKIISLKKEKEEFKEKQDFYKFQIDEIENVDPKIGEDDELEAEYKRLFNAGKIKEKLGESTFIIKNSDISIISSFGKIQENIGELKNINKEFADLFEKIENLYYDIEELAYSLENSLDGVEISDTQLEYTSKRLDELKKLKLKYGTTNEEIIEYKDEISKKLENILGFDERIRKLDKELKFIKNIYVEKATQLTKIREKIAENVESKLTKELETLNMKGIKFQVQIDELKEGNENGLNFLEFKIATNVGEKLNSLQKIVSGGEVSRIMLALKSVFSSVDNIPVLVFDEIDTGIGGETVIKVADKLHNISKNGTQVICITHSPHIAAIAKQHYFIKKVIEEEKTSTIVNELTNQKRVLEIARMLGGNSFNKTVIEHAKELLKEG